MAIFSKKHSNSKETEMQDSSTRNPDWRALYAATIWEQSMLSRCTSGQGAGPRFGWNKSINIV